MWNIHYVIIAMLIVCILVNMQVSRGLREIKIDSQKGVLVRLERYYNQLNSMDLGFVSGTYSRFSDFDGLHHGHQVFVTLNTSTKKGTFTFSFDGRSLEFELFDTGMSEDGVYLIGRIPSIASKVGSNTRYNQINIETNPVTLRFSSNLGFLPGQTYKKI